MWQFDLREAGSRSTASVRAEAGVSNAVSFTWARVLARPAGKYNAPPPPAPSVLPFVELSCIIWPVPSLNCQRPTNPAPAGPVVANNTRAAPQAELPRNLRRIASWQQDRKVRSALPEPGRRREKISRFNIYVRVVGCCVAVIRCSDYQQCPVEQNTLFGGMGRSRGLCCRALNAGNSRKLEGVLNKCDAPAEQASSR